MFFCFTELLVQLFILLLCILDGVLRTFGPILQFVVFLVESHPFLRSYLTGEIGPVLESMGYTLHVLDNPAGVDAPFLVARRIVPFVKPGDILAAGQRVGLIRFGSRVDVYLPAGTEPKVVLGQKIIAGETVLAELGQQPLIEGVSQ